MPSDLRARVFAHAAQCGACSQRLEGERGLTAALVDLSLHTESAPFRIEQALRRELTVIMPKSSTSVWRWAAPAIAAAILLAISLVRGPGGGPAGIAPNPSPTEDGALVAGSANDEDSFVPLPYAPDISPSEPASIVQVEMPREELLSVGFPVSGDRMNEQIRADVLIGPDGTARAIRLAR